MPDRLARGGEIAEIAQTPVGDMTGDPGAVEQIAQMFACSEESVRGLYKRYEVSLNTGRFGQNQQKAWEKFTEGRKAPEAAGDGGLGQAALRKDEGEIAAGRDGPRNDNEGNKASRLDGFRAYENKKKEHGETDSSTPASPPLRMTGTEAGCEIAAPAAPARNDNGMDTAEGADEVLQDYINNKVPRVKTRLRAFRVELCGPMDEILQRMRDFAGVVDGMNVLVIVSVDEEEDVI